MPAGIPCRIEWVEHLVAQQYGVVVKDVRRLVWRNLATIIDRTNTHSRLPKALAGIIAQNWGG